MYSKFKEWLHQNEDLFVQLGIQTEEIESNETAPRPFTKIINFTKVCYGQVSVCEPNLLDYEVLDYETSKTLIYKHVELDNNSNFTEILTPYLELMRTGTKR